VNGLEQGPQTGGHRTRSDGLADVDGVHSMPMTSSHIVVLTVYCEVRRAERGRSG
jgi:hypothetical protein